MKAFRGLLSLIGLMFLSEGCGKIENHTSDLSVYGGRLVDSKERVAEYTVALVQGGKIFCTGVLVSPTVVVTAAHCKEFTSRWKKLKVGFGLAQGQLVEVSAAEYIIHPDYNPRLMRSGRTDVSAFDIAVITLKEKAPDGFSPIRILADSKDLTLARSVLVAGYGKTDMPDPERRGNTIVGQLLQVNMKLKAVEPDSQEVWFGLTPGKASCNGDSGGPGVVVVRGVHKLLGVTSRGIDCRSDVIYTDVTAYADWLAQFGL